MPCIGCSLVNALAMWMPAYIGLGSNLDDPRTQIEKGFGQLDDLSDTRLVARSCLYGSKPLGPQQQPDFVNAVAGILTRLSPHALLRELQRLETAMGRSQPVVRWGPRRIDFDLLVYADVQIAEPELAIPHPGIPERNFVLYPLRDIAIDLMVPDLGRVRDLATRVHGAGLYRLAQRAEDA